MRDIRFRGFHECDGPETIVVDGVEHKGRWVFGYIANMFGGLGILPATDEHPLGDIWFDSIIPSTLGQFTGLRDINDKEVGE